MLCGSDSLMTLADKKKLQFATSHGDMIITPDNFASRFIHQSCVCVCNKVYWIFFFFFFFLGNHLTCDYAEE